MSPTKNVLKRMMRLTLLVSVGFAALLSLAQTDAALAATAPSLGAADSFAVLGAAAVTNTGPTVVTGDLGISPNNASSVTGFPPGTVIGAIHAADPTAANAQIANATAYGVLAGESCDFGPFAPTDLAGQTLVPGVYCYSSSVQISAGGVLTLNAQGNNNAVWVFKIGSTLTTISGASVVFINGGQDCNVFWQVGSSATLGTTTRFVGNILALESITLNTGATLSGRALAQTGAVTLDSNFVSLCSLSLPPPPNAPTLGKGFNLVSIIEGGVSTLTITLSNPNTSVATLSAPLIDTLPTGVVIAATPNASTTCIGGAFTPLPSSGDTAVTLSAGAIPAGSGTTPGTCTVTMNVTAATAGSYVNTLLAGALVTSNGNNAPPAIATLTVNPLVPPNPPNVAPTLGKGFIPVSINAGGSSTLTITLSNPNAGIATLTAPFTDILPTGVVIATTPNASTTCGGGATVTATAGGNTVTLPSGATIPASSGGIAGTCTVTVVVTAASAGAYLNTLAVGVLQTSNGSNTLPAIATLTVVPLVITPPTAVPTLSEWGMIIFMAFVGLMSIYYLRRQKAKA
jgi:hypothetical protein